jgi:hypothetical protein
MSGVKKGITPGRMVGAEDYDYGKREGSHVDPVWEPDSVRFASPVKVTTIVSDRNYLCRLRVPG